MDSKHILEQLNKLEYSKFQANPIITELNRIYKDLTRLNKLGASKLKDGYIIPSDADDIFSNSSINIDINIDISGEIDIIKKIIYSGDIPISTFDVLIAHYLILVSNNKLSYPAIDKKLTINRLDDILFIKVNDKCSYVFTANGECFTSMNPLRKFEDVLCYENSPFVKINKDYIINVDKIEHIDNKFRALVPFDNAPLELIIEEKIFKNTTPNQTKIEEIETKLKNINKEINECQRVEIDIIKKEKWELERERLFFKLGDIITTSKINNRKFIAIRIKEELQKKIQEIIMTPNTK